MKSRTKGLLMLFCAPLSIILWQVHLGDYDAAVYFALFSFIVCWVAVGAYLAAFAPGDSHVKPK